DNRVRIIDVSFNDLLIRSSILSKSSSLRNSSNDNIKRVFIGKHLTKQQI
ncbi:unnamed protein product, partial [Didymodactylos carnosus]